MVCNLTVNFNPHLHVEESASFNDIVTTTKQELCLRGYQNELAEPALPGDQGGKNTIVRAPTGSGKTLVAVKVAMEFLQCDEKYLRRVDCNGVATIRPRKVVFLVNQVSNYQNKPVIIFCVNFS